jgi:hypothetical protein
MSSAEHCTLVSVVAHVATHECNGSNWNQHIHDSQYIRIASVNCSAGVCWLFLFVTLPGCDAHSIKVRALPAMLQHCTTPQPADGLTNTFESVQEFKETISGLSTEKSDLETKVEELDSNVISLEVRFLSSCCSCKKTPLFAVVCS